MAISEYNRSVFVNCPFDEDYADLLPAIVFTIHACCFKARCALESSSSIPSRIEKLHKIIEECRYGVHDISRTQLNPQGLPRFNMPLELGIFLGAARHGTPKQRLKQCVILDTAKYRYQRFCSDLAGNDPKAHRNTVHGAVRVVRNWLRDLDPNKAVPSGNVLYRHYRAFRRDLPVMCMDADLEHTDLGFNDLVFLIDTWLA